MATKSSILIFYLNLARSDKIFRWTAIGTLIIVNVAGSALALLNIFQCRPLSILFDTPKPAYAHCTDIVTLYLSSAPVNIITDLIILLLPMPVLKGMHLPRKQKIILFITFGFGIFVAVVDVVRISYLQEAAVTRLKELGGITGESSRNQQESDFSWYASYTFMWSAVEVNVGIMCACVPALKPLVARFMPNIIRDKGVSGPSPTLGSREMAMQHRVPSVTNTTPTNLGGQFQEILTIDFLTTPDTPEFRIDAAEPRNYIHRTDTAMTNNLSSNHAFYDFVNFGSTKSIVKMTFRESIAPVTKVTILFFLWGFAYGLLNTLNSHIQNIAGWTPAMAIANHSAYYAGYFVAPLTFGRLILKHWGFKACYIAGLLIYGTGTLIFWPAAVLTSFPAFIVSNFIVGLGLSTLEVGANPFITLCGPPEYGEMRLNLSQGFQALGSIVSPLLAKKALFKDILDAPSLIDVQWTYLAITLFTFVLAFIYYAMKLPEVTDDELEEAARQVHPWTLNELHRSRVVWFTLAFGVLGQFCYVGAQESVATSLTAYLSEVQPGANEVNYEAVGHTLFAVSRFLAAGAGFLIAPRHQLVLWFSGAILFSALSMNFSGLTSGAMVMCVYFFEGPLFSLLFAIPLRALGRHTRDGSALLTAAIGGGAVFPPIMHAVAEARGSDGYQYAYCVIIAAFAAGTLLPIYINLLPLAQMQVDTRSRPHRQRESLTLSFIRERAKVFSRYSKRLSGFSDKSTETEKARSPNDTL